MDKTISIFLLIIFSCLALTLMTFGKDMYCTNCGAKIDSTMKFCPQCGTKLKSGNSTKSETYVIPYSSYKYLTEKDLKGLSAWELNISRNEIYARYGRIFQKQIYKDYFNSQSWYKENQNYSDSLLNEVELYNANFIKEYQEKNGVK